MSNVARPSELRPAEAYTLECLQEKRWNSSQSRWMRRDRRKPPHIENFLLKHGQFYRAKWVPWARCGSADPSERIYLRGCRGECYLNAALLALRDARHVYAEGFATTAECGIPLSHGWVVDEDGNAIDTTLPEPGIAYYGVPIAGQWLMERLGRWFTEGNQCVGSALFHWAKDALRAVEEDVVTWKGEPGKATDVDENLHYLVESIKRCPDEDARARGSATLRLFVLCRWAEGETENDGRQDFYEKINRMFKE